MATQSLAQTHLVSDYDADCLSMPTLASSGIALLWCFVLSCQFQIVSVGIVISNDKIMGSAIFITAAHSARKTNNLEKEAEYAYSTAADTSHGKRHKRYANSR